MLDLTRLRERFADRSKGRKKQRRLFRKTGEKGHAKAAAEHGRAIRKLAKLIAKAKRLYSALPGPPAWGGSKRLIREKVAPIVAKRGITRTSAKRWETYGNPGSDHYAGNVNAYAEDYATAENFSLAQEIRTALDGGTHVDYETFPVEFHGRTYWMQIIAGTHGTGPHLHVGAHR